MIQYLSSQKSNIIEYNMLLSRKFSEKEVLEIIARYAVEALPEKLKGMVEAKYTKQGSIEVFFIENQNSSNDSESN